MSSVWYVLRSKPNREFSLYAQIKAHELECYFPRIKVTPRNPRAAKIRPYFRTYIFVYCDLEKTGVNTLKWMPHAHGLVSFDGEPATVPDPIINGMKKHIGDILDESHRAKKQIEPGTPIVVTQGPFQGYEGVFDTSLDDNARVKVLLDLIDHRKVPLTIDPEQIKPKT